MLKPLLMAASLVALSPLTQAELNISEKVRPAVTSLVNPAYERMNIPATPNNMILPSFGKGIIGWGAGPNDAEARFKNVTAQDVAKMKTQGLTLEMAQAWQAFYDNETLRNPGNPTAPFRAQLMKKIVALW
jgi:hypothetical protein